MLSAFFSDLAVSILPMLIADIESRRRFLTPSEEVHIARATLPYSFTLISSHRIVENKLKIRGSGIFPMHSPCGAL